MSTSNQAVDFAKAAASWIASRASRETRAAYSRDLALWVSHCQTVGVHPGEPTADAAIEFRNWLQDNRAALTVRRVLATLSAAYEAVQPASINHFSTKVLPRPPATSYTRTREIYDEVARAIIAAAGERGEAPLRDRALLYVLYATGMRRVSAVSIRREKIIRQDGLMILPHVLKGGREWEAELTSEAMEAVEAWLVEAPPSKWLFCLMNGEKPLSVQAVTNILAGAAAVVGVRAHPHQFRSSFITRGLDAKIGIERIARAVGHLEIKSTQRYDHGRRGAGVAAEVADYRSKKKGKP